MVKIFISYAREDIDSACRLYNELGVFDGISPWMDKECLPPGSIWKIEIKKALIESKYVLILLSENSIEKRGYIQKEIREAIEILDEIPENQPFLIPIRLKDVRPHFEKLNEIQFVDFFPSWNEGFNKILNFIQKDIESFGKKEVPKKKPIKFIKHDLKSLILIISLIALTGILAWLYAISINKAPDFREKISSYNSVFQKSSIMMTARYYTEKGSVAPRGNAYFINENNKIEKMLIHPVDPYDVHTTILNYSTGYDQDIEKIKPATTLLINISNNSKSSLTIESLDLIVDSFLSLPKKYVAQYYRKGFIKRKKIEIRLSKKIKKYPLFDAQEEWLNLSSGDFQGFTINIIDSEPGIYMFHFSAIVITRNSYSSLNSNNFRLFIPRKEVLNETGLFCWFSYPDNKAAEDLLNLPEHIFKQLSEISIRKSIPEENIYKIITQQ